MNRELDPIYLAARTLVERVLDAAHYRLAGESHHPDTFGSAHAEYYGRHERIRLFWDGRDRYVGLAAAPAPSADRMPARDAWRPIDGDEGPPAYGLVPGAGADARIAALVGALRRHLGLRDPA